MKIIVSHDVDHWKVTEHFKDLFFIKLVVRNFLYLIRRKITLAMFIERVKLLFHSSLNNLEELLIFNKSQKIKGSFFVGVENALNLSYSKKDVKEILEKINEYGCEAHVHGISFNDKETMRKESIAFANLSKKEFFGMRMHYLRSDSTTLQYLESLNYTFDSTIYDLKNPYKVGNMIEFPASIMDVYAVKQTDITLERAKELTLLSIQRAIDLDLKYYTIISHDFYYCKAFQVYKDWYEWIIGWFKENKYEFIGFEDAINEVNLNENS